MATERKLMVEAVDARNLLPKDGHGTSSPYVVVDFEGQRRRTQTVHRDLNPTWNEVLDFKVMGAATDLAGETLEVDVLHDRRVGPTRRNNFLGRVRLNSDQFVRKGEEAHMYYPLEKKSFFSWIQGDIGLKIYYVDYPIPPPPEDAGPPDPPPPELPPAPSPETTSDAVKSDAPVEPPPEASPTPAAELNTDGAKSDAPVTPAVSLPESNLPASSEPLVPPPEPAPDVVNPPESDPPKPEQAAGDPPPPSPAPEPLPVWHPQAKLSRENFERRNHRQTTSESYGPAERITRRNDRPSYDLVQKMHYLFVRIVKARSLPGDAKPFVKIAVSGCYVRSKTARKTAFYEWDQTFAFARDAPELASTLEISVWAHQGSPESDATGENFLGGLRFDVSEITTRDPPDSPLALQWYRLEGGGAHHGDLMLATWIGTQADEAFSDAWKTDTAGNVSCRSKVYLSPKLWYLRATILEAQDLLPLTSSREAGFQIKAQLGFQVLKTRISVSRNGGSPLWNEDLIFIAAEPFGDQLLVFSLERRHGKDTAVLGVSRIPLSGIERRVDDRKVVSRWLNVEDSPDEKESYHGRIHVRVCFDGGYHVMDESAHVSSDYRPTARQLWKPPTGTVELGIIGCRNLLPMKTLAGKGSTDAYSVAKYGEKWARTRTVSDSLDPRWNEQYTWQVYDPCTVLTIGVFDSWGVYDVDESKGSTRQDFRIGKVRIRLSTLECNRVYKNTYPLLLMLPSGVKKMGEIDLAVRFARAITSIDLLHVYTQPLLPLMHYLKPIGVVQQDALRNTAAKIIAVHLSGSEPPMRREVVLYMLDADSHVFSMRKVRANWYRIMSVLSEWVHVAKWLDEARGWKNPTTTLLTHALVAMIVCYPDLLVPTIAFYVFAIGAWNYRFRRRAPLAHLCVKLSQADAVDLDELDEEFDSVPSAKSGQMVRARYDKLRTLGARVQTVLGDVATQLERLQALVTWRDPRATGIFVAMCLGASLVLYLVPSKMVAIATGFYYLRHPMFRDRMPPQALNFFRRLPSLSDRIM